VDDDGGVKVLPRLGDLVFAVEGSVENVDQAVLECLDP
jgi:hypothetical protein